MKLGMVRRGWLHLLAVCCWCFSPPLDVSAADQQLPRTEVRSTHLASVGYDPGERLLEIEFRTGEIYRFYEVPAETAKGLITAESKGTYFARHIKGRFTYQRLRRTP